MPLTGRQLTHPLNCHFCHWKIVPGNFKIFQYDALGGFILNTRRLTPVINICFLLLLFFLIPAFKNARGAEPGWARISLLRGQVQVKLAGSGQWGLATLNAPLGEGDQVWVPDGAKAELQTDTGLIRLNQDSSLQILSLQDGSSHFYLSQGQAYINFLPDFLPYNESALQVDTPDSTVRAFDTAIFRIDISDQYRYTDISVYEGEAETENASGQTSVPSGYMISVGADTDGELAELGPPDQWERWNRWRDSLVDRQGISERYLPAGLDAYSYDLDNNGKWVWVPGYGNCWTPTDVPPGWAPYRFGRWVWINGVWTWVSNDPWGWAPYHYGRWFFAPGAGWCWVPPAPDEVYWGPGYVGWVVTDGYVGWVPLAPRETYYGYGYYGPHSVNVTNVNITRVNVTTVYRNVYVNGATVVTRNTFATASPRMVRLAPTAVRRRVFTINNIRSLNSVIARRTALRPARASVILSPRPVPGAKLPPARVRNVQVSRLRQSRPFVKNPARSVWNPGTGTQRLHVRTAPGKRVPLKTVPALRTSIPAARGIMPGAHEKKISRETRQNISSAQKRGTIEKRTSVPQEEFRRPGRFASPSMGKEKVPSRRAVEKAKIVPSGSSMEKVPLRQSEGKNTSVRGFGPVSTPGLRRVSPAGNERRAFVPQGRPSAKKSGGRAGQKKKKEGHGRSQDTETR